MNPGERSGVSPPVNCPVAATRRTPLNNYLTPDHVKSICTNTFVAFCCCNLFFIVFEVGIAKKEGMHRSVDSAALA